MISHRKQNGKPSRWRMPLVLGKGHFVSIVLVLFGATQQCCSFGEDAFATQASGTGGVHNTSVHFLQKNFRVSINDTILVPLSIRTNSSLVNIVFKSGPEISPIANKTDVSIKSNPQVLNAAVHGVESGHCVVHVSVSSSDEITNSSNDFMTVDIRHSAFLDYIIDVVGWLYFAAWSVSFYPQIFLNCKRRSVVGLHFDFLSLNTIGFTLYGLFNVGLYWIPAIQEEYFLKHPFGVNPVQLNDVIFSLHALFACAILVGQCIIFEKAGQVVSSSGRALCASIGLISLGTMLLSVFNLMSWLNFLYILSYLKLFITLIKYIPQAYFNYVRKSTYGWSIWNILFDFTGGNLSIAQMFLLAYNYNDWESIFGDPTKFGLGVISIAFDILFIVQHYILYNGNQAYGVLEGSYMEQEAVRSSSYASENTDSGRYGAV